MPSSSTMDPVEIIFKEGDDLKQVMLVIQVRQPFPPSPHDHGNESVFGFSGFLPISVSHIHLTFPVTSSCSDAGGDGLHLAREIS